jgi:hypothetical protein
MKKKVGQTGSAVQSCAQTNKTGAALLSKRAVFGCLLASLEPSGLVAEAAAHHTSHSPSARMCAFARL